MTGYIASPDATEVFKQTIISTDPVEAGKEVAKTLRAEGAAEVIERVMAEMEDEECMTVNRRNGYFYRNT